MKFSLLTTLLLFSLQSFAGLKSQPVMMYEIISDTLESSVPEGKCLITGIVTHMGKTINEATIFSESTKQVNSDKLGRFKILVDTADTYLVIQKKGIPESYVEFYKFRSQHHINLKVMMPTEDMILIVDKPVIYAYGSTGNGFEIGIQPKGEFTFTYPIISSQNSWTGTITADGIAIEKKVFPYLFYESKMTNLNFLQENNSFEGSVVSKEQVVSFLENSLTDLNLNNQEKTDFITYWAPRMINHDRVFIQFWTKSDYDIISSIDVSPKPDNIGRVFMTYAPLNANQKVIATPQVLTPIQREGFTIIEWGGSELPTQKLYVPKTL